VGRIVLTVFVAVGTAWVGSRVNRTDDLSVADPDVPDVFRRPIADTDIEVRSFEEAMEQLSRQSGGAVAYVDEVRPEDRNRAYLLKNGPPIEPLRLRRANVGTALAAVARQFHGERDWPPFVVRGGLVEVGGQVAEVSEEVDRAYDVRDLLAPPQFPWSRSKSGGMSRRESEDLRSVHRSLLPRLVAQLVRDETNLRLFGDYLVVRAPPHVQRDAQRLLLMLRHGRLAETPRVVEGRTSGQGSLR
jgi:hypothetical protein